MPGPSEFPEADELRKHVNAIWADVLDLPSSRAEADFFDLGGSSAKVVQLLSRVRADLGIEMSVREFLTTPTVDAMVERGRNRAR